MPLHLDAAPPEAYIWSVGEGGPRAPILYIFARGHMALCAVSGQFVVPLEPAAPVRRRTPSPGVAKQLKKYLCKINTYSLLLHLELSYFDMLALFGDYQFHNLLLSV